MEKVDNMISGGSCSAMNQIKQGGAKCTTGRISSAKKNGDKASKSRASSAKGKKQGKKTGGALMDDLKNLAVPFAILLAKQGLQGMFESKDSGEVGVASDATTNTPKSSKTASKPSTSKPSSKATTKPKTKQSGGECSLCTQKVGGSKKEESQNRQSKKQDHLENIKGKMDNNYAALAQKIDEFLARY